ncbi:MAG: class II aldolase/adducin family protein [Rubinisphaera brasiliensis]|uniref:L-fuculose-phosphate aldolase n=1 Tax=Rubinisphaera brasiliensis (strain ATCC 49424 / DSM 5305 / JCM 21570 / IAM 15109 / NBRC 103401 / IFAM 1448) TaxID=756272 RepID=F0SHA5_RUBBR|nr:L-fuculose-phosphate aldolase [Rubinisphaera brasiliensis DSM 5305]MBR9804169.1 class II aldolase/adducin family protein [bacterium]
MENRWNSGIHDRKLKEQICEIGRRVYDKGFAAANDGNISIRVGDNEVLCSPTMICKGFMTPDDICAVDMNGDQLAGKRKRTSEVLLHLAIMKERPDVKAVVHCHPPHATAFAVAREAIPQCVLPEVEVFMGEVPLAPYETPGGQEFASTVVPFLKATNTIILTNHGTVSFGKTLEEAYWKTEILDAYCRILILAKQIGGITYLGEQKSRELIDLKKRLGFDDPRFHNESCDLCGNSAFRDGYKEDAPQQKAFEKAPEYPGYLQKPTYDSGNGNGNIQLPAGMNMDDLVKMITDQVVSAMGK